jgi:iron complex outermembrane receptor protein
MHCIENIREFKMKLKLIVGLVSAALPLIAQADAESMNLSPVIVIGEQINSYSEVNLAGSVDTITRDELAESHVDNSIEMFSKIPGVYLSNYNQGVINQDLGIRGFASDGESPHAKLLIDGIPSNMHNGYTELDQVFPGNVQSITAFKGTSDPRYGLYNLAGNYNVETRSDTGKSIQATLGTFNTKELQGYWGEKTGDLSHSYFFGYRDANGYRDSDSLERYSLSGRWFYDFSPSTSLGFIVRLADFDADSPGYLTAAQLKEDRKQQADFASEDSGNKQTQSYSLHFDHKFTDDLSWSVKSYFNDYERERFVNFGSGLRRRINDEEHYGLISNLNWNITDKWSLQWGADIEHQDVVAFRKALASPTIRRDWNFELTGYGTYLQLNNAPTDWLEWNVAVRADKFSGDGNFINFNVESEKEVLDDTIIQPKANVFFYPTDTVVLFANYGRTFQPLLGSLNGFTDKGAEEPDVPYNDGWEIGTKWQPNDQLQLRISYWEQHAEDEYVNVDGTLQVIGKTVRKGFDTGFDWKVSDQFTVWGNYATADSEIKEEGVNKGNELRGIFDYTASLGTTWLVTPKLAWKVHYDVQGDAYINEGNKGGKFGDYKLVNTSLDYKTSWGSINGQINNLFDEEYEYVYDFSTDASFAIFSPGNGINGSVSVTYDF